MHVSMTIKITAIVKVLFFIQSHAFHKSMFSRVGAVQSALRRMLFDVFVQNIGRDHDHPGAGAFGVILRCSGRGIRVGRGIIQQFPANNTARLLPEFPG